MYLFIGTPPQSYGTSPTMGLYSVTCHPIQVNASRFNPSWYSIYLTRGMEGWVDLGYPLMERPIESRTGDLSIKCSTTKPLHTEHCSYAFRSNVCTIRNRNPLPTSNYLTDLLLEKPFTPATPPSEYIIIYILQCIWSIATFKLKFRSFVDLARSIGLKVYRPILRSLFQDQHLELTTSEHERDWKEVKWTDTIRRPRLLTAGYAV